MDTSFDLRRWKFEHWFARTYLPDSHRTPVRGVDDKYLEPLAELAWSAWQEAVSTVTEIPCDWELSFSANSKLAYEFRWLYGVDAVGQLPGLLQHEPRIFEMAVRHGYIRFKEGNL